MSLSFHGRYLELVAEMENRFAVAGWMAGDAHLWPLARMDLYLDMYGQAAGQASPARRALPLRAAAALARPALNLWRSRRDLAHMAMMPRPAHAAFLGDGLSLDRVDGHWQDRHGEPLVAALEAQGRSTFLMQGGQPVRLPWRRRTFAANVAEAAGVLVSCLPSPAPRLPDHAALMEFLSDHGVAAPALTQHALAIRARELSGTAWALGRVLDRVKPRFALLTSWYAGLGPAFALACRRRGILCVDVQNAPQGPGHKAVHWSRPPARGYTTLPALFWTWTGEDAGHIRRWSDSLEQPWHRAMVGGNTQHAHFAHDDVQAAEFAALAGPARYGREILVALQPIAGHRADWDALAAQIGASPPQWRWWIRRHPASHPGQDAEFGRLLSLEAPRVLIGAASGFPLPVMLPRMSVLVSLASGAAAEAETFGVPALFLSQAANALFPELLARGAARTIAIRDIHSQIACLPPVKPAAAAGGEPGISGALERLEAVSREYARMGRSG